MLNGSKGATSRVIDTLDHLTYNACSWKSLPALLYSYIFWTKLFQKLWGFIAKKFESRRFGGFTKKFCISPMASLQTLLLNNFWLKNASQLSAFNAARASRSSLHHFLHFANVLQLHFSLWSHYATFFYPCSHFLYAGALICYGCGWLMM